MVEGDVVFAQAAERRVRLATQVDADVENECVCISQLGTSFQKSKESLISEKEKR